MNIPSVERVEKAVVPVSTWLIEILFKHAGLSSLVWLYIFSSQVGSQLECCVVSRPPPWEEEGTRPPTTAETLQPQ